MLYMTIKKRAKLIATLNIDTSYPQKPKLRSMLFPHNGRFELAIEVMPAIAQQMPEPKPSTEKLGMDIAVKAIPPSITRIPVAMEIFDLPKKENIKQPIQHMIIITNIAVTLSAVLEAFSVAD
eukprot:TRINITY_DN5528_c0_g4_i1.p4 TRINITY_DN5528_c0_g4~~TRINITY_DN5528_c0_g4_i1.p4  ORF type:complete len:123 (+),score=12.06 TRINITY_DN5528_c0_g4_i1:346-714(+)